MRNLSVRFIKCVIGLSVALIAVSNCFNVLSNSPNMPADDVNQRAMAASRQYNSNFSAPRSADNGLFAKGRESVIGARAELAAPASAFSPFAPNITATKSHTPPSSANPGDTLTYSIVISNSGTDATGVNFTDTIDPNTTLVGGSVKASPSAVGDAYHTIGNVNISVPAAQGVVANDSNSGFGTLSVTMVNATAVPGTASTANGSVTMNSDGSFSYTPNVAFRGPSDSFTYTLDNGSGFTDTATVTISVNGLIWFVNVAAAPGGDGRLSTPFNCLVGPGCFDPAAADIANDNIFVYTGAYVGGLTLLSGQKLIGQGAGDTLLNITGLAAPSGTNMLPSTGGTPPTIVAAGANITLGTGNTIRGVTLNGSAPAAVDLTGTAFGTATIAETALGGVGRALNLNNGTLTGPVASTAAFTSVSSTGSSTTGITLTTVAGNMSSGSTSITTSVGIGISVNTSSAALNFGTTGSTASGGTGVSLVSNTGTITFGSLNISPVATQQGLVATNNSNTITTTSGTITTSGAAAVNIIRSSGTTPLVISLTSVSDTGGANGIVLTNTSGSFTVVGDGSNTNNSSGGTIQSFTGNGIQLSNVSNLSLTSMTIRNGTHLGINGTTLSGFTLSNCSVLNNGTTSNVDHGIKLVDVSGTATFTSDTVTGNHSDQLRFGTSIGSSTVTALLTVTNGTYNNSVDNEGIQVIYTDTSKLKTAAFTNVACSGNFSSGLTVQSNGNSIVGDGVGAPATGTVTVSGCTFANNGAASIDIDQGGASGAGQMYARILNNISTCPGSGSCQGMNIFSSANATGGTMKVHMEGNQVGNAGVAGSGSTGGPGIRVFLQGKTTNTITMVNNTVRQTLGSRAIDVEALGPVTTGQPLTVSDIVITGNSAQTDDPNFSLDAIFVAADNQGSPAQINAEIHGNSVPTGGCFDYPTFDGNAPWIYYQIQTSGAVAKLFDFNGPHSDADAAISTTQTAGTAGADITSFGGVQLTSTPVMSIASAHPVIAAQSSGAGGSTVTDGASTGSGRQNDILHAARGRAPKDDSVDKLTQAQLNWMVQAAIARWVATGISAEDLARMQAATFEIAGLPDGQIASSGSTHFKIDETAAGYGWFLDQSPVEDSEFDVPVPGRELQTTEFSPAHGRMDLLTVVMRDLGTIYVEGKNRIPKALRQNLQSLMESTLSPSVRRMPVFNIPDRSTSSVKPRTSQPANARVFETIPSPANTAAAPIPAVFYSSPDVSTGSYGRNAKRISYASRSATARPFSGETVNLSIGTIPAGESVTITFQVTVDNPFPNGVCNVTNQGHVTGSNFSPVDTNSDVTPINKALTIGACPSNITTNTDPNLCTAVVAYTTPTADGCPAPTVTCNPTSGSAFNKGTTTVTCTASNGVSPDQSCTFTVTVNDNQPPTVACPSPITTNTDPNVCSAVVTYTTPSGSDNCPGVTVACNPSSGSTFNKGTTTVTCTATDASSLTGTCSFTVTIVDNQSPTIGACPSPITTNTAPNMCSAVVTYTTPGASDNCPGVTVGCTPPSGTAFPKGTTLVTCTATDTSSHTASCSFNVTVVDNQPPSITCPGNINTTEDSPGSGCATVTYTTPTPSDNCPGATANCTPASGTCFSIGTTTVTCTAMDTSANTSQCQFTVTVTAIGLTSLSPAKLWLGLKNSDDVGTKFDLLAEVLRNGSVVGSGQLNDVPGGSSGFNNAVLRTITLSLASAVPMGPGDTMSFRLSVRIGATSGHSSGTARLWYNGQPIDSGASRDAGSRFDATIAGSTSDYFLRSPGFTLSTTAGSSRVSVDKLASLAGGNPWQIVGTWSKTF